MKNNLVTNAGNLKFWKQVQKEISEFTCPIFLCRYSNTFEENWNDIAFIKEVHELANKFLADKFLATHILSYKVVVNNVMEKNKPLFDCRNTDGEPISTITNAVVRIAFVEWIINYLNSIQNQ